MKLGSPVVVVGCIALFIGAVAACHSSLSQYQREDQLIEHEQGVIEELKGIVSNVRQSESAERGYLNTDDLSFLQPYYRAATGLQNFVNSLAPQLADNPVQEARLRRLDDLIQQKLQWEEQLISTTEHDGRQKAIELQRSRAGLNITKEINQLTCDMEATENKLVKRHRQTMDFSRGLLILSTLLLSLLGLVFLLNAISFQWQSLQVEKQRQIALQQLEAMNHDLNQQVAELLRTREDLAKALDTRTEFIANVSHELRTPLAGVIGAAELLLAMPLRSEQRDLMQIARNCAESLQVLISDILDFASIDSHGLHLSSLEFDLSDAVTRTLEPLKEKAKAKGLELNLRIAQDVPPLMIGDQTRVCQVLANLVDNAIKFTEQGGVTIGVFLRSEDSQQASICFAVSDTGVGIAHEQLNVVFERFAQVDSSTTRQQGGAGLGLAICRSLVELMNGAIEVSSTPGLGSQFSATIPFAKPAPQMTNVDGAVQATSAHGNETGLQPQSVLVVDDSLVIRIVVTKQLERLGYDVETASSGQEAIEATKKELLSGGIS